MNKIPTQVIKLTKTYLLADPPLTIEPALLVGPDRNPLAEEDSLGISPRP